MFEWFKDRNKAPRQNWKPHWSLGLLHRIWMILFSALKVAVGAAATVLLIAIVCGFVFVGVVGDYLQEDILPMAGMDIDDVEVDQSSTMYYVDSDGEIQVLQNIFAATSSKWANLEDIPEDLIHAAVAIEDHRFYTHQGVDWVTTIKACARMFFGDDSVGGSSITQQLIKNLLLFEDETADDVTVQRKVLEIFRALQLEKRYHKDTIMEMYLNCIYLGQGCRGVRSAAETYFGKELELLTAAECASLISITNSPTYYDPYQNFENNKKRKEDVLWAMREYGWLEEEEYREAIDQELVLKVGVDEEDRLASCENEACNYRGTVSTYIKKDDGYYCPVCKTPVMRQQNNSQDVYSWFADTVLEDVAKALADQSGFQWNTSTRELMLQQIQKRGYHIYTTFDKSVQDAVDAVYTDLDKIPDTRGGQQLRSAIVIIDNRSGDIVGMAGDVGKKTEHDAWNRATDSKRQSGSCIKPITVYAPAFESGAITPATVIDDMPLSYANGAYPLNDTRTYAYARTIYRGVVWSVNAVAANVVDRAGENYVFRFAKERFRLSTLVESYTDPDGVYHTDIDIGPLALGAQTFGVTVREMTSAFATFANEGTYRNGRTFSKVYDSKGNLILDNKQESEKILSEKSVDYMNFCLTSATREGTGTEADLFYTYGVSTAGKTGTSGDNYDRWYCGFTGYYTAAVWCGFESPESIYCYNVNNPAANLFKQVMGPLHKGKSDILLYSNSKLQSVNICLASGKLATSACVNDIRMDAPLNPSEFVATSKSAVYPEDMPTEYCDKHVLVDYCSGGGVATQWCKNFAEVDKTVKLRQEGLVKLTQSEINEMLKAAPYRLVADFLRNDYVYYINSDGSDGIFKGFYNNLKQNTNAPYVVCKVHTKQAWERYEALHATEPETTAPTVPVVTQAATTPTETVGP
ncbi:MAG: transglycosylase domain-containing protein [Oscillospiraceae bacterium]|nr:transglycosylase domain-containing protein [Oscillospiraceae bacterium]MBQ8881387.1 transglycosylase domain-containing protein [Oscillospiraceae bacterium]